MNFLDGKTETDKIRQEMNIFFKILKYVHPVLKL